MGALSVDGFHPIQFEKALEDILYVKHTEQYIQFEAIVIPSHKDDFKQPEMTWLYDDRPGFHKRDGRDGRELLANQQEFADMDFDSARAAAQAEDVQLQANATSKVITEPHLTNLNEDPQLSRV